MLRLLFEAFMVGLRFFGLQYVSTERYLEWSFGAGLAKTFRVGRYFPFKIEYIDFCHPKQSMRRRI